MHSKSRIIHVLLISSLLLISAKCAAKQWTPYFANLGGIDKQLSIDSRRIQQSKNGFIWIGTTKRLLRYDGYQYSPVVDSVSHEAIEGWVRAIWVDPYDRIWIATLNNGLKMYDQVSGKVTQYQHDPDVNTSISSNRVEALTGDKRGIWIGTNAGLDYLRFDTSSHKDKFTHYRTDSSGLIDNHIRSLLLDDIGNLLIGNFKGLEILDLDSGLISRLPLRNATGDLLQFRSIRKIYQDKSGALWLGTHANGVIHLPSLKGDMPAQFLGGEFLAYDITEVRPGEIWVGRYGFGIRVYDQQKLSLIRDYRYSDNAIALKSRFVYAFLLTASKQLLFASGVGLQVKQNQDQWVQYYLATQEGPENEIERNTTSIIQLRNNELWLGNRAGTITVLDKNMDVLRKLKPQSGAKNESGKPRIRAMLQLNNNDIWLGTEGNGLFSLPEDKSDKSDGFRQLTTSDGLLSNVVFQLFHDDGNKLWVVTDSGLNLINTKTLKISSYTATNQSSKPLKISSWDGIRASDGTIWVITPSDVYRAEKGSTSLTKLSSHSEQGVVPESIYRIFETKNNDIYLTGLSSIWKMDRSDPNNTRFTKVDIAIPTFAMGIEDAQGILWHPKFRVDLNKGSYQSLSLLDGIGPINISHETIYKISNNHYIYGGNHGLVVLRPKKYQAYDFNPNIVVSRWWLDDLSQQTEVEKLKLKPTTKSFSVEFSALDFGESDAIKYEYMLENFDLRWTSSDSTHRRVRYTNLDPGEFVFRVRSTNGKGKWSANELRLPITVLPAWYQTPWFRLLAFIISVTSLYFLYRMRVAQLKHRQMELQTLVDEQTQALSETILKLENTQEQVVKNAKHTALGRLVTGVAHELNTPLGIAHTAASVVGDSFEEICTSLETNQLSEALLERIRTKARSSRDLLTKNLKRLSKLIDSFKQVSADQNAEQRRDVNLLSYIIDISRGQKNSLDEKSIELTIQGSSDISINTYPGAISRIINELLINAINHGFDLKSTDSNRSVIIKIGQSSIQNPTTSQLEDMITVSVTNNGASIPEQLIETIFDPFVSGRSGINAVGLGLHIAYNIMTQQLKGSIFCEVSNQQETRFVFQFPARLTEPLKLTA